MPPMSTLLPFFKPKSCRKPFVSTLVVALMLIASTSSAEEILSNQSNVALEKNPYDVALVLQSLQSANPTEFFDALSDAQFLIRSSLALISSDHSNAYKYHELNQKLNQAHAWIAANSRTLPACAVNFLEGNVRRLRAETNSLEEARADLIWASLFSRGLL